jgi:2-C-methyl-D-erythritol 2,4-cyclodiphosphate synthase
MYRIGNGFDAHKFTKGKDIVLGGVTIPFNKKFLAHSDGDVLIHALCDALLGAMGMGDIGHHFPDTKEEYKNIDSRILLKHVVALMHERHFKIENVDITIIAQEPKMASYIDDMQLNLASDMDAGLSCVNVKATTTEKMGFTGRGEGVAVLAVALLYKNKNV